MAENFYIYKEDFVMAEKERPNVLFFHVDNLGYGELGCYGGGILRCPCVCGMIQAIRW